MCQWESERLRRHIADSDTKSVSNPNSYPNSFSNTHDFSDATAFTRAHSIAYANGRRQPLYFWHYCVRIEFWLSGRSDQ
jgi:hypothetical protein